MLHIIHIHNFRAGNPTGLDRGIHVLSQFADCDMRVYAMRAKVSPFTGHVANRETVFENFLTVILIYNLVA